MSELFNVTLTRVRAGRQPRAGRDQTLPRSADGISDACLPDLDNHPAGCRLVTSAFETPGVHNPVGLLAQTLAPRVAAEHSTGSPHDAERRRAPSLPVVHCLAASQFNRIVTVIRLIAILVASAAPEVRRETAWAGANGLC
jgi:hypothetical protein